MLGEGGGLVIVGLHVQVGRIMHDNSSILCTDAPELTHVTGQDYRAKLDLGTSGTDYLAGLTVILVDEDGILTLSPTKVANLHKTQMHTRTCTPVRTRTHTHTHSHARAYVHTCTYTL